MIDLFATDNAKCQKVCYRVGVSPGSYQTPPFYGGIKVYCMLFPLIPLIHKVIRKIKCDKATIFLMAPYWLRQFWLRDLLQMSSQLPFQLPHCPGLISQLHIQVFYPNAKSVLTHSGQRAEGRGHSHSLAEHCCVKDSDLTRTRCMNTYSRMDTDNILKNHLLQGK